MNDRLRSDVLAAASGDTAAFERLVTRHRRQVFALSRAWLRDQEAALDATQDTFIEAHLRLSDLREPERFPGWLRRIAVKQCDRRTRRPRRETPLEGAPEPAAALESSERDTERRLEAALEQLPVHERIVVALSYLAEASRADIAALLELTPTTVDKRLSRARARLRSILGEEPEAHPAPNWASFEDRIGLFLALRAGDATRVEVIADRRPELVEAPEQWTAAEALEGGFTLAHRATPLGVAAQLGDPALVARLLARGARPDTPCGCDAKDTPLFAAVAHGRLAVTEQLLAGGANPNLGNARGWTPLHVATLRGQSEVVQRLRAAGAAPQLRTTAGLGVEDLASAPLPPLRDGLTEGRPLETGIKALDLLAPLQTGMRVHVQGAADTGLTVLLSEVSANLRRQGIPVTWVSPGGPPWVRAELEVLAAGRGLDLVSPESAPPHTAWVIFAREGAEARAEAQLGALHGRSSLVLYVDPWAAVTRRARPTPELEAPWSAVWVTSPEWAAAGNYPALDPERTRSRATRSERHRGIADRFRSHPNPAAQAFLTQPFGVCAHETGWLGVQVSEAETLDGIEALLESPGRDPEGLRYVGRLPDGPELRGR